MHSYHLTLKTLTKSIIHPTSRQYPATTISQSHRNLVTVVNYPNKHLITTTLQYHNYSGLYPITIALSYVHNVLTKPSANQRECCLDLYLTYIELSLKTLTSQFTDGNISRSMYNRSSTSHSQPGHLIHLKHKTLPIKKC